MRLAISRALLFPQRAKLPFGSMNWPTNQTMDFFQPDTENFPALDLAVEAGKAAGGAPCWFNAANEATVSHFLAGEFGWRSIGNILSASMEHYVSSKPSSIQEIYDLDRESRRVTEWLIQGTLK
jgi:1-deoxy-D-xylulose-5-phosphate reductoisomerase